MCGIVGAHGEKPNLQKALGEIVHRGPDGKGITHRFKSTLGHTRLAIIDVEGGQQPMTNPQETRWLVCNGEIYNHADLRAKTPDYSYKTSSDNEVILALYEQHGAEMVRQLDGMFAFALVDGERLLLARDPLGIKPLYYGWDGDTIYFASEIKALRETVKTIEEFPPGHWYDSETGFTKYYDVVDVARQAIEQGQTTTPSFQDIQKSLERAVEKRLMSDVPLGVFLSGGLDSSIIAGLVAKRNKNVHSFAVGFEDSEDVGYARKVAEHLGTQHHEYIYTVEEMLEALPTVIYHLESFDPSLVRSAIPNYFLSRLASQYVTVVLSGEGADELYGGYHYFKRFNGEELHIELAEVTNTLHSCNLLRCDRMSMAHSLEARVPFLDTDFINLSFAVPVEQKIYGQDEIEKWALRKAFEGIIPDEVIWRVKQQFSKGAGSAYVFEQLAENEITDEVFQTASEELYNKTGHRLSSKEELYYFRIFSGFFPVPATSLVKRWRGHIDGEKL